MNFRFLPDLFITQELASFHVESVHQIGSASPLIQPIKQYKVFSFIKNFYTAVFIAHLTKSCEPQDFYFQFIIL